ncbi:hypothetical protein QWZ10_25400 [Paracoccus cavernae]|uniref:Uncharacterized protein n=1 Tax=Paracoccus cavernae TaxID=1571207 RepID=A0ABT8DBZ1_9RHOB|nr:hypothetical protein [Paracoccus cavernae]
MTGRAGAGLGGHDLLEERIFIIDDALRDDRLLTLGDQNDLVAIKTGDFVRREQRALFVAPRD